MKKYFSDSDLHLLFLMSKEKGDSTLIKYPSHPSNVEVLDLLSVKYPEHSESFQAFKAIRFDLHSIGYYAHVEEEFIKTFSGKLAIKEDLDLWFPQVANINNTKKSKYVDWSMKLLKIIEEAMSLDDFFKQTNTLGLYSEYIARHPKKVNPEVVYFFSNQKESSKSFSGEIKLFTLLKKCPTDYVTLLHLEKMYKTAEISTQFKIVEHLKNFDSETVKHSFLYELGNSSYISEEESVEYNYRFKLNKMAVKIQLDCSKEEVNSYLKNFGEYIASSFNEKIKSKYNSVRVGLDDDYVSIRLNTNNLDEYLIFKEEMKFFVEHKNELIPFLTHPDIALGISNFKSYISLTNKSFDNPTKSVKTKI